MDMSDNMKCLIGGIIAVAIILTAYYLYKNECYIVDILKGDALARSMMDKHRFARAHDRFGGIYDRYVPSHDARRAGYKGVEQYKGVYDKYQGSYDRWVPKPVKYQPYTAYRR